MKHTLSACLYVCGLSVYLVRWIYKMVLDRTCFLLSWSVSALSRFLLRLRCALFRRSRIVQIIMLSHVGKYWFTWWTLSVNCKSILFRLHVFLRRDNKLCALRVLQIFCKLVSVEQFGSGTFIMTRISINERTPKRQAMHQQFLWYCRCSWALLVFIFTA